MQGSEHQFTYAVADQYLQLKIRSLQERNDTKQTQEKYFLLQMARYGNNWHNYKQNHQSVLCIMNHNVTLTSRLVGYVGNIFNDSMLRTSKNYRNML